MDEKGRYYLLIIKRVFKLINFESVNILKKALLLCASHNDLGLVKALRKLGYYIIVTGNIPNQPGEKYADEYIQADYSDKDLILSIAQSNSIDAIVQCCNDFGVYTAAYVAEKMNLPGYDSYDVTCILHNKDRFKKFACEHGIISPVSKGFTDSDEAVKWIKHNRLPMIIKPTDASAGNGISRVDNDADIERSVITAFSKSRVGRVVAEPFITGSQHGFCTFLINRKVVAICCNNEYSFINPYRVEIDTFPADNYDKVKETLVNEIEKIAKILNLKDGIFHLQYIYDGEKPQIIEVMRRVLGNMYSVPGNMLNGIDWDYWETRARCGLSLEDFPTGKVCQEGFYAYKTILAQKNGDIKKIDIPKEYERYIVDTFYLKQQGDHIRDYKSEPIGFAFMMFSSMDEMKRILVDNYRSDFVTVS